MIITKEILRMHAERFLDKLREENITSLEIALRSVGQRIKIREILPDLIHIYTAPSNLGTTALKMSYECQDFEGVPIEMVVNPALEYRQTIVKCTKPVIGYTPFGIDDYGNLQQFKKVNSPKWNEVISDLEELTRLT